MLKHEVQQVAFGEDGSVQISYVTPERDIREPGVVLVHNLVVPKGFEYDDEIAAVMDAVHYLINDVLDDFDKLPVMRPDAKRDQVP